MKDETADTIFSCIGVVIITILALTATFALDGFVLMKLWNWFIVPLSELVPKLDLTHAIGVGLVSNFLIKHAFNNGNDNNHGNAFANYAMRFYGGPLLVLFLGWILLQFM